MRTALIVEEDPAVRRVLLRALGRYGWWVDAVDNYEDALPQLAATPREVVLIDWLIGDEAGPRLLSAIMGQCGGSTLPIVMMPRTTPLEEFERAIAGGAGIFLPKPFTGEEVIEKLRQWLPSPGPTRDEPWPWATCSERTWNAAGRAPTAPARLVL